MGIRKNYKVCKKPIDNILNSLNEVNDVTNYRVSNDITLTIFTMLSDWANSLVQEKDKDVIALQALIPYQSMIPKNEMLMGGVDTDYTNPLNHTPYRLGAFISTDITPYKTGQPTPNIYSKLTNEGSTISYRYPKYLKSKEYSTVDGIEKMNDICIYISTYTPVSDKNATIYLLKDDMHTITETTSYSHLEKIAGDTLYAISYTKPYMNDKDGEYSSSNRRKDVPNFAMPGQRVQFKFNDDNIMTVFESIINLNMMLTNPFTTNTSSSQSSKKLITFKTPSTSMSYAPANTLLLFLKKYKFFRDNEAFLFTTRNPDNYEEKSEKIANCSSYSHCIFTKQALIDFFFIFGIRASFTVEHASYKNTIEWTDIPSGELPLPEVPNIGNGVDDTNPEGGGEGIVDDTKDPIEDGDHSTGVSELSSSYLINYTQLKLLQENFNDASKWTDISRWFYEPSSAVINILRFPFDVSKFQPSSQINAQDIAIMGRTLEQDGITINGYKLLRNAITRIPMGSINIQEYYGTFLDYDPYTKISVYLPYFGFFNISAMNTIGKTLKCWYNVSYTDGSAIATLESDGVPIYIFKGQIGYLVPMCKTDALQKQQDRIMNAIAGSTSILSQGASGVASAVSAGATGGSVGASAGISGAGMVQTAMNTASSLVSKTSVIASGTTEGQHSRALTNKPYMIIERPVTSMPSNYGGIRGYQCNLYGKLSEFKGYTVCDNVKLDGIFALDSEKERLKTLLCKGVIL